MLFLRFRVRTRVRDRDMVSYTIHPYEWDSLLS